MTFVWYMIAALAEIAGCFAFWAWARLNKSALWLIPGPESLALFASILTRADSALAGRAYAAWAVSISRARCCGCGWSKGTGPTGGTPPASRSACSAAR